MCLLPTGGTLASSNLNISLAATGPIMAVCILPERTSLFLMAVAPRLLMARKQSNIYDVTVLNRRSDLQSGGSTTNFTIRNLLITSGILSAPSNTLFITGNWTNNSTFTANNGAVSFSGGGAQSISSGCHRF